MTIQGSSGLKIIIVKKTLLISNLLLSLATAFSAAFIDNTQLNPAYKQNPCYLILPCYDKSLLQNPCCKILVTLQNPCYKFLVTNSLLHT